MYFEMKDCLIVRYDELVLKSRYVEHELVRLLLRNIKHYVPLKNERVVLKHKRMIVYAESKLGERIAKVFGVNSVSPAVELEQDINLIKEEALAHYKSGSFRVSTHRSDKDFKLKSQELNTLVGAYIVEKTKALVDLEDYDTNIGIELFDKLAYVFSKTFAGYGGLPSGCQGRVLLVLEDRNSILAGLMMMNRGCSLLCTGGKELYELLVKTNNSGPVSYTDKILGKNYYGVVLGRTECDIEAFKKDKEYYKQTVFYPLIGLDTKKLANKYSLH
jgi:thiamine biosynthesis protein ThiI